MELIIKHKLQIDHFLGLITVNKNLEDVQKWILERMNKEQKVGNATGTLRNFIIEPFVPHQDEEEMYVCIYSHRHADTILFYHRGGVDIGDVDSKAVKLDVPIGEDLDRSNITKVSNIFLNFEKKVLQF